MLEYLCVTGGNKLTGEVTVSGAKNAALPLIVASLLSAERCSFHNVPDLQDIAVLQRLLRSLGAQASISGSTVVVEARDLTQHTAPYALVKSLRASFWVLGPLLARRGKAAVALPGGDAIGTRPVDLHLKGLQQLGADIRMEHGVVTATAPGGLSPATIELEFPSVGATHQLLMTAALVPGTTVLRGAAREPEIVELANLLVGMGADIEGAGSGEIKISGRKELGGVVHSVLGDRIEAATYLLSGAVTGGDVRVNGIPPDALRSTLDVLRQAGCEITEQDNQIALRSPDRLSAVSFATEPYPGVATDVQPLLMAAMCYADGVSEINETVFESRFGHVAAYRRFGADISIRGRVARVTGVDTLSAAPVEGLDIRAAAGMVLMGLVAEGTTQISDIHHLDRGYGGLAEKLHSLGATISRLPAYESREVILGC